MAAANSSVVASTSRLSPVGSADLASLLDRVAAVEQVSPAFVLVGTWWSRGADPDSTPAVLDSGLSQFWFAVSEPGAGGTVFVWHDYSLLDQSIELSVALSCSPDDLGGDRLRGTVEDQCDHVRRSVHLRRVIARTVSDFGPPHPAFRTDGTVPQMITDRWGRCHDVAFHSADSLDLAGDRS